jgi:predicted nucleotidyltransferase
MDSGVPCITPAYHSRTSCQCSETACVAPIRLPYDPAGGVSRCAARRRLGAPAARSRAARDGGDRHEPAPGRRVVGHLPASGLPAAQIRSRARRRASGSSAGCRRPVLRAVAAEHGYSGLAVFGSSARHQARPDSDIDLLLEAPDGTSTFGFSRFKHLLEQILGREIDLIERGGLKPVVDDDIRREAVLLWRNARQPRSCSTSRAGSSASTRSPDAAKDSYLEDALLQEIGDSLTAKLAEAANQTLPPDGVEWALVANRNFASDLPAWRSSLETSVHPSSHCHRTRRRLASTARVAECSGRALRSGTGSDAGRWRSGRR